eukprot:1192870-Prorocentrum_minimum.AAC.2
MLKCWGRNNHGQLGLEDTQDRGGHAGEMGDNLPTINFGTGHTGLSVCSGDKHSCVVLNDRR